MIVDSGLRDVNASLMHLVNGITLFKSNIKQAQCALLKVLYIVDISELFTLSLYVNEIILSVRPLCPPHPLLIPRASGSQYEIPSSRFGSPFENSPTVFDSAFRCWDVKKDNEKNALQAMKASANSENYVKFVKIYETIVTAL